MPQTTLSAFIPSNIRWLAKPLGIVFLLYWLERFAFIGLHFHLFVNGSVTDWMEFTWLSVRFDTSTIASVNAVFLVFLAVPFSLRGIGIKITKWLFCIFNWTFLAINLVDIWFFTFNRRRISFDVLLFLWKDLENQAPQLISNYWYVAVFGLGLGWILWKSFLQSLPVSPPKTKPIAAVLIWLGFVALTFGLIRNSFLLKPLLPGHAFALPNPEMGHGILNTPFVLFKTYENEPFKAGNWLSDSEIQSQLISSKSAPSGRLKGANVVLLILESFATEYTGLEGNPVSYTPFLDSLARTGIYFPHHFANGRTSKDAMPALLAGIPAWMDESFASSQFGTNSIDGLGSILTQNGYKTAFYHGGKNGTMSFDVFTKMAGLQKYKGMNEYPGPRKDYDGNWGIFDEPFLQFMAQDINSMKQPFAAVAFTLSSHQPYTLPDKYKGKFKKGPLPIHEAVGYADFALRQFFTSASQMPWFKNTIFILTADHTQQNHDPRYADIKGQYDVPLIFWTPNQKLSADTGKYVKHVDVSASLIDILGINRATSPLGISVFNPTESYPIEFQNGLFLLFHPAGVLTWKAVDMAKDWTWIPKKTEMEPNGLRKKMVAQIQYFQNGMVKNQLSVGLK